MLARAVSAIGQARLRRKPRHSLERLQNVERKPEMHRSLRKRNPAPLPVSLAFWFGCPLPDRLNFACNPKSGRKQSLNPVSPTPTAKTQALGREKTGSLRHDQVSADA